MKEITYKSAFFVSYCACVGSLFVPLAYFNFIYVWPVLFSVYAFYLALSALFFGYVAIVEPDERCELLGDCKKMLRLTLEASTGLALIGAYHSMGLHFGLIEHESMDGDFPKTGYLVVLPAALFVRAGAMIGTTLCSVAFRKERPREKDPVNKAAADTDFSASRREVVIDIERVRVYRP